MESPDLWRQVGNRIGFFTKETSSLIPEAPGCYAWFIPLWIYSDNLGELVHQLNSALLHDPLTGGEAEETLKFNWDALKVRVTKVPSMALSETIEAEWNRIKSVPKLRAAFQQALMEASIFMPPLYVGKTEDLRARYQQHVEGTGGQRNVFHKRFTEFVNAVDLPLSVSDLLFVCIKTDRATDRVLRDAAVNEVLERILMMLCKPAFSLR